METAASAVQRGEAERSPDRTSRRPRSTRPPTAQGESPRRTVAKRNKPEGRNRREAAKPRGPQRSDVITAFLKKAYAELHPTGVLLSLDVFGVMAWQRQVDLSHTGQDIVGMAHYCDVLSPMIYPSHFFGMDNIAHPGDEPAHFIGESMDRFELITKRQRRRHPPLAASLPLAHQDLLARIHKDSGRNRQRKRWHRILVLERRQRLLASPTKPCPK